MTCFACQPGVVFKCGECGGDAAIGTEPFLSDGFERTSDFRDVYEMHKHFEFDHDGGLRLPTREVTKFRANFLKEELNELRASDNDNDLAGFLDALVDLVVVAYGTAVMAGVTPELWSALWADVHRANMSKIVGTPDARRDDAIGQDLVKPAGWVPPQTEAIIKAHLKEQLPGPKPSIFDLS
jgi:predicted HAD superfamily Cof-like phosphohydrolase